MPPHSICDQFLVELDKLKNMNSQVYFFSATNHPEVLCSAFISRMNSKIEIPLPDLDDR